MRNWRTGRTINVNVKKKNLKSKSYISIGCGMCQKRSSLGGERTPELSIRQAWAKILAMPKNHCISQGINFPILETEVCVN